MHSPSVSHVGALLLAASLVGAQFVKRQTDNGIYCPGVLNYDNNNGYCCVGGTLSIAPLTLSSCAGWPICTGPVTVTPASSTSEAPLTCATVIPVTAADYSSLVAQASASLAASGTSAETTITDGAGAAAATSGTNGAAATDSSSPSTITAAATTTAETSRATAGTSSSASSSSSSAGAVPVGSQMGALSAGMIAALGAFLL